MIKKSNALEQRSADHALEKRFGPIAIALIKVVAGQFIAGAAKLGVDAAKAALDPLAPDFKNFDDARRHFTPEMAHDMYKNKGGTGVKGESTHKFFLSGPC